MTLQSRAVFGRRARRREGLFSGFWITANGTGVARRDTGHDQCRPFFQSGRTGYR